MIKRVLSMLLALVLLCGLLPLGALQAEAAVTKYDLFVAGVQVTSDNKTDILGNGYCRYDPARKELLIREQFYSPGDDMIVNHIDGLTVWMRSDASLFSFNGYSVIKSSADLTLRTMSTESNVYMNSNDSAPVICMSGNSTLTLDHVFLNIDGGLAAIAGTDDAEEVQTLVLQSSYLDVNGSQAAVVNMRGGVYLDNTGIYDLQDGDAVYFDEGTLTDADGKVLKYLKFRPTVSAWYLQVDGVLVYEDNKDDILGDGGSAKFDPDTQTLTFNNPKFADRGFGLIRSGLGYLKICGSANLKTKEAFALYTLNDQSVTTINGDFTFYNKGCLEDEAPAIYCGGVLWFEDGMISVTGKGSAVEAGRGVLFSGGTVTMKGKPQAIEVKDTGEIAFENGMRILEPSGGKLHSDTGSGYNISFGWSIVDANGKLAKSVTIGVGSPFEDVKQSDSYYNAVLWAVSHKPYQVTAGIDKTHFGPNQTVTRAQAMTFFWAALDRPKFKKASTQFVDVKKTDWFYKPVMWAVEQGVTAGTDATHFSPNKTCNRGEILTFLYASLKKPKVSIKNPYKDVGSQWYKKAALWAWANGIERGENGTFNASTPCTRASTVTYLYRFFTGQDLAQ